ncbi:hypothetical protein K458DRAFT_434248 [Lentithecium fluviatile CBS 122367]|uniref:Uncharacterized protein n=1 Tax=Lentithecium fluviatile CBS 122367 TaxID=1168545 RepID=A0A6G1IRE1_9PLEO|nr:hypothetical protein K458DRAFT_434248 [Lentithecium fluviatile CBS 122367]
MTVQVSQDFYLEEWRSIFDFDTELNAYGGDDLSIFDMVGTFDIPSLPLSGDVPDSVDFFDLCVSTSDPSTISNDYQSTKETAAFEGATAEFASIAQAELPEQHDSSSSCCANTPEEPVEHVSSLMIGGIWQQSEDAFYRDAQSTLPNEHRWDQTEASSGALERPRSRTNSLQHHDATIPPAGNPAVRQTPDTSLENDSKSTDGETSTCDNDYEGFQSLSGRSGHVGDECSNHDAGDENTYGSSENPIYVDDEPASPESPPARPGSNEPTQSRANTPRSETEDSATPKASLKRTASSIEPLSERPRRKRRPAREHGSYQSLAESECESKMRANVKTCLTCLELSWVRLRPWRMRVRRHVWDRCLSELFDKYRWTLLSIRAAWRDHQQTREEEVFELDAHCRAIRECVQGDVVGFLVDEEATEDLEIFTSNTDHFVRQAEAYDLFRQFPVSMDRKDEEKDEDYGRKPKRRQGPGLR